MPDQGDARRGMRKQPGRQCVQRRIVAGLQSGAARRKDQIIQRLRAAGLQPGADVSAARRQCRIGLRAWGRLRIRCFVGGFRGGCQNRCDAACRGHLIKLNEQLARRAADDQAKIFDASGSGPLGGHIAKIAKVDVHVGLGQHIEAETKVKAATGLGFTTEHRRKAVAGDLCHQCRKQVERRQGCG